MRTSFFYRVYNCDAFKCEASIDTSSTKSFEDCDDRLITETKWKIDPYGKHFCPQHKHKANPKVDKG